MPAPSRRKDPADALARASSCSTAPARDEASRARAAGSIYPGRARRRSSPAARRIFDVLDVPTRKGSAGIGIDATEAEACAAS